MGGRGASSGYKASGPVDGKDILGSIAPSASIQEVLKEQGFDGKPTELSGSEFDDAVKKANGGNGLFMQRVYSADSEDALEGYHDALVGGKWYVDAGAGTHFGKGMYTAADFSGQESYAIKQSMKQYANNNETMRGLFNSRIETMTMRPDAKIITYPKLVSQYARELSDKGVGDYDTLWDLMADGSDAFKSSRYGKGRMDLGTYAASRGYDAINAKGDVGRYLIVLNRTKLIVKK